MVKTLNVQYLLTQTLDALGISAEKQSGMIKQVDEVLRLRVVEKLVVTLEKKDQNDLRQQLKSKKPEEQREILDTYLRNLYTEREVKDMHAKVAQEIIPDYIKTILGVANEEQKQKVNQLLQGLANQPSS